MCGIAGIIDPSQTADQIRRTVRAMTQRIVHRGPDEDGCAAQAGIGIGMRRLSIIDVAGGHQPIANETGDIHIVCNGEIYNFQELRDELERLGHRFTTSSDSEVALHLYEEYGDEFLKRLRGMFGLAILDQQRKRLLVARDRLGKKPLFYAQRGDKLYFGSEMKSLLAAAPELTQPNYKTLGQFFQVGFIRQPESIYQHIARLPAGHFGVWQNNQFSIAPYWSIAYQPDDSVSEQSWREQLDRMLAECVKVRLHSEVPLGVFLSGGLDSSAIVAYAHAAGLRPLKTFTIGFDRKEWDESEDAARIANHFGTEHHLLRLSESDMLSSFEDTLQKIVFHCDEPFGDASALPTYHISRLAREHVTVILSGDGGDELFAGYSSYQGALFAQTYRRWIPYPVGRHVLPALARAAAYLLPGSLKYKALRAAKVFRDSALPLLEAYRDKTSIWRVDELRELLSPEVLDQAQYLGPQYLPDDLWKIMLRDGDLVGRLTEIDVQSYMLDDILVKVDRMSMAHSLEVRSPLLDHNMVELAMRIPTGMKIRNGRGKHIFREVLRPQLPPPSIHKGKQGFSVPLRDWFRGQLSGMVHDYLGTGGYLPAEIFSQRKVQAILQEHRKGRVDHANKIWLLLTFAAWHRRYQRAEPVALAASQSDGRTVTCES